MRFNPTLVLSTSALALTIGLATPAFAQDSATDTQEVGPNQEPDPACANMPEGDARDRCISGEVEIESGQAVESGASGTITVTGTRIRRPNVESNVPITSVSAEDLTSQGDVNVGDALNDLPSLRSTFNQSNSTRFIGTTGLNVLDLRGLGVERTLVLVNGRRHITAQPGDFLVDVNTIPSDLIERVDVITGGSSAVYGSDAVAGVVNFILKRDYEGISLRGQAGVSSRGDRGIQFVSLTAGENFLDDRLNAAVNLEYAHGDELRFTDRPNLTGAFDGRCQFNASEPPNGEPGGSDGIPDQTFFCGVRNAAISNGGTITAATPVSAYRDISGPDGVPDGVVDAFDAELIPCNDPRVIDAAIVNPATAAQRCLNAGNTTLGGNRFLNFAPSGSLVEQIPVVDFRPFGSGNYIASDLTAPGATLRDTGQLIPGIKRFTANLLLNYDASPAFQPFFEAKYVSIKSNQEGQPSFFQSTFPGFFGAGVGVRCDNPFLTAENIASLQTIGRCPGGATSTSMLPLARFNVDFGPRKEIVDRDTFRFVGGIRGDFNDDWNYEVAVNYGKVKIKQTEHNDLHIFNIDEAGNLVAEGPFLNAIDAVRLPTGQIVCRINANADPSDDDPACVPINVLGFGSPSQAALDYVNTTSFVKSDATEFDATAYVGGDSSQLFELPGGPIRFVLGAEYRRETAFLEADPLSAAGATFFNAFATFDPPALEVIEGFGEVEFPILRDVQFAKELTFTAAGRYSDYNKGAGTAGTTFAWNVNGTWAPVSDIRFRANYSKSVRVPTLSDLFTPPGQNFAFVQDPCDKNFINNGPNRAANCAALGVPANFENTIARSQTIGFLSGGNPDLQEETGKSFTVGGVLTPRWVPGLSLTVDYYKITVDDLIAVLSAQQILNQCVDQPDINNQFCDLIAPRLPDDPTTIGVNEQGFLDDPALLSSGVNFAKFVAKGIDFELAYRRNFANGHRLNFRGIATRVLQRSNFTNPVNPDIEDRILSELGDPKWAANATVTYGIGRFDLRYTVNYIGKATIGTYEAQHEFDGNPPTNADLTEEVWYPDAWYHSIRLNTEVADKFNFYVGVDNLFDKKPPLGLLGTAGGDPYDTVGRFIYAGAQVEF